MFETSYFAKLTSIAIVATTAWTTSAPKSLAASDRYSCKLLGGVPHTFVKTTRGNVAMIKWQSAGKYSAKERCITVSRRFQAFADNGMLRYLGTGIVNNSSAICAVVNKGDSCTKDNLLITLIETDRHEAARRLLDIRNLSANGPVPIRGENTYVENQMNGEYYFNVEAIEEVAKVVDEKEISAIEP